MKNRQKETNKQRKREHKKERKKNRTKERKETRSKKNNTETKKQTKETKRTQKTEANKGSICNKVACVYGTWSTRFVITKQDRSGVCMLKKTEHARVLCITGLCVFCGFLLFALVKN
jgi:hypothetical protein